jgi:hypothetical protein
MINVRSTLGLDVFELDSSHTINDLRNAYLNQYKYLIREAIQIYNFQRVLQEDKDNIVDNSNYLVFIRPIACHHH